MRKTIYTMTAAALLLSAAPAHANARAQDGKVHLWVQGKGLRVDDASGFIDGHGTGVRGRLITYTPEGYRSALTGWKDATPVTAALTKISDVGWTFKGGKKFTKGTKLCIEFNVVQGEPCAVIHP
ncbi:hypothetical protein AB0940_33585 [Streptomyces sp. NPDC006656]|uniref:hypothetical protein n=1 Tax=Streptomyces sp. NPDC006656 TaxID=3156899 RepID=UPI00345713A9